MASDSSKQPVAIDARHPSDPNKAQGLSTRKMNRVLQAAKGYPLRLTSEDKR
jgi:hypothetical protein